MKYVGSTGARPLICKCQNWSCSVKCIIHFTEQVLPLTVNAALKTHTPRYKSPEGEILFSTEDVKVFCNFTQSRVQPNLWDLSLFRQLTLRTRCTFTVYFGLLYLIHHTTGQTTITVCRPVRKVYFCKYTRTLAPITSGSHCYWLIIIKFKSHSIMYFVIFKCDMIFIYCIPFLYPDLLRSCTNLCGYELTIS